MGCCNYDDTSKISTLMSIQNVQSYIICQDTEGTTSLHIVVWKGMCPSLRSSEYETTPYYDL